ncbi:class I SAM-dependent methyltransferase [Allonocardiopsis opalescens]|uniref:Methyltransferase family protein n=1 Tax=Allonocardiopsis opalescens TaxID=1144618 RepID=A0A2T0Q2T9_9ACTN|nr:class I SAM-dependent methyltransferase [Allonocardiopsis opalescens]PRX98113.1 methyltransferase family protein [Allonocardiopsis opalescens]
MAEVRSVPASAQPWRCDPYAEALLSGRGPLFLRRTDGWLLPLEVERWCADPDDADATVLDRCEGAVLDVGCGPGRMVAGLVARGRRALGVDVHPVAVTRTADAGGTAVCRSVFEPLPDEGRWDTALLVDGNIGIGGAPGALLTRMLELVRPGGLLLVEAAREDVDERVAVQVSDAHDRRGGAFPWARLGLPALLRRAEASGWSPAATWHSHGRRFAALRAPG